MLEEGSGELWGRMGWNEWARWGQLLDVLSNSLNADPGPCLPQPRPVTANRASCLPAARFRDLSV